MYSRVPMCHLSEMFLFISLSCEVCLWFVSVSSSDTALILQRIPLPVMDQWCFVHKNCVCVCVCEIWQQKHKLLSWPVWSVTGDSSIHTYRSLFFCFRSTETLCPNSILNANIMQYTPSFNVDSAPSVTLWGYSISPFIRGICEL